MGLRLTIAALVLVLSTGAAAGPPSVHGLRGQFGAEANPAARRVLVREIARRNGSRAASVLDEISRSDSNLGVRLESIRALARIVADNATALLLKRLRDGGVERERIEIARSIDLREGGPAALRKLSLASGLDPLTRGLLIEAYGPLRTRDSLPHIVALARSTDSFVRGEALRALARRPDGLDELTKIVNELLRKTLDTSTTMLVLGLVDGRLGPEAIPLVVPFESSPRAEIRRLAEQTLARLRWRAYEARRRDAKAEGYGIDGDPPREPDPRPRYDLVFGIDSTGSMCADLESVSVVILRRVNDLVSLGADVRVGLVRYRDSGRSAGPWEVRALPLTHDLGLVKKTLTAMRGEGANDASASIFRCLGECYDRMGWRWDAVRRVTLVADTRCDDLARASRVAAFHRSSDGTRLDVWFALHTRTKVPEDVVTLAQAGGGTLTSFSKKDRGWR